MNKQVDVVNLNSEKWNEYVFKSDAYDFYHTSFYHSLDNSGEGKMLICKIGNSFIAFPFIVREITGTDFFDITSAYGYLGPVSHIENEDRGQLIKLFHQEFATFCESNKVISAFTRLHPLIQQNSLFNNFGKLVRLNHTVSIDLSLALDEQRKSFRKSLKSELNQLRKKDIKIILAEHEAEVDTFVSVYHQNMNRVSAGSNYYFTTEYFKEFLKNKEFESFLLLAKIDDQIIAGAIFTITNDIMQYHLAGTDERYLSEAPMKLILDEARIIGTKRGLNYLHLGGGLGGSDEDSLFKFKAGFSKLFNQFTVWQFISNINVYNEMSLGKSNDNYFPLYRS